MDNNKKSKPDIKLIIGFIVAVLALVGGIIATIVIRPESGTPTNNESTYTTGGEKETETEITTEYDTSILKTQTEKVEELFTKFDDHIKSKYGSDATSVDLADDSEAQVMIAEFLVAIDELDRTISRSPFDDLKAGWQSFQDVFNKRREYITKNINDKEDSGWAIELVGVYLMILSKVDR